MKSEEPVMELMLENKPGSAQLAETQHLLMPSTFKVG